MTVENFISQADALELLGRKDVSFVDGSWYLPAQGRDGHAEYLQMRIPGAVYFDINAIADQETELPHMLPSPDHFAREVSKMGISEENLIIVYDGPGLFSAARVWWTFKTMGAPDVRILEGGIDGWKEADLPLETGNPNPPLARLFNVDFNPDFVVSLDEVQKISQGSKVQILDARPEARFNGTAPEPRPGMRSGHIPGSKSLPFQKLMDGAKMKRPEELDAYFSKMGIARDTEVVTTCGSGVTAAIITLALAQSGRTNTKLYDGSWAEWGLPGGPEIETNDG